MQECAYETTTEQLKVSIEARTGKYQTSVLQQFTIRSGFRRGRQGARTRSHAEVRYQRASNPFSVKWQLFSCVCSDSSHLRPVHSTFSTQHAKHSQRVVVCPALTHVTLLVAWSPELPFKQRHVLACGPEDQHSLRHTCQAHARQHTCIPSYFLCDSVWRLCT